MPKHYYKNHELAKLYGVSRQSVGNWIESARNDKLDLDMIDIDGKTYIVNSVKNRVAIESIVKERKKYFNTRSHKTVSPKPEFYTLFMPDQVADIISHIRVQHEILRQYNYFGEGALAWDAYTNLLFYDLKTPNFTNISQSLLQMNEKYLDNLLNKYTKINIVDIGSGNALAAKSLLTRLVEQEKLGRYIAIDISPDMLAIAGRNIKKWFGDKVDFVPELRDINYERFGDLLISSSPDDDSINLVLFFGGTLHNLRSPNEVLRTIYHSMAPPDILLCPLVIDTPSTRQSFFFIDGAKMQPLPPQYKFLVDLLGIEPSLYDVEMGFNEKIKARYLQIRMKVAVTINFELNNTTHKINLNKDDTLLVWRYWHQSAVEIFNQFENSGFGVLQTSQTPEHDCMFTICDIKTDR